MQVERISYLEFDDFRIDVNQQKLFKTGKSIALSHKTFQVLLALALRPNQIVEKELLLSEIWTDSFVEESNLTQYVHILRKTLGQRKDQKPYIETLNKIGYRFSADVRKIADEENPLTDRLPPENIKIEREQFSENDLFFQANTVLTTPAPGNSGSPRVSFRTKQSRLRVLILTVLLLILATAGVSLRYSLKPDSLFQSVFRNTQVTKITSGENVGFVTVSPDGKYLAMVEKRGQNQSLMLRQLENSSTVEIIPSKKQQFVGVTFSPDAKQIYYVTYDREQDFGKDGLKGRLYKVPILGGVAEQVISDIDSPISISPDGRDFAFIRNYLAENKSVLIITDFETKTEKILASRNLWERFSETGTAWSPDRKTIAVSAYTSVQGEIYMSILAIDVSSGEQKPITSEKWLWAAHLNWLTDGSGIIFAAFSSELSNQADEIWQVSYPNGELGKIMDGINGVNGLSLTNNSQLLLAVKSERLSEFWVSPADNLKQAQKIDQNLTEYYLVRPGISWTPDGRLIFGETLNGNLDIWAMKADGTEKKQITTDLKTDSMPVVSSDGQNIFFISDRSGQNNLWTMKSNGNDPRQLTFQNSVSSPSLSTDGKDVYYSAVDKSSRQPFLFKISGDGVPVQLTSIKTLFPEVSPDGQWIACFYPPQDAGNKPLKSFKLTILSSENGRVVKQFGTFDESSLFDVSWLDNQTVTYIINENGGSQLWQQKFNNDAPQKILDSPEALIFRFAWSPDGKNLVYEKGLLLNEIILIKSV